MNAKPLKRTPLYHEHVAAGARMVEFGGWEMPVQYTGIIEEHRTTRSAVGLFDVSHMGEFEVEGPGALAALQSLTTNDVASLQVGQIQYSVLCYASGTIVDDLTVYRVGDDRYMITVNAGNIDKDWAHVTKSTEHVRDARWRNASEGTGLIAVQGPKAEALVGRLSDRDVTAIGYYRFARGNVGERAGVDLAHGLHRRGRLRAVRARRRDRAALEGAPERRPRRRRRPDRTRRARYLAARDEVRPLRQRHRRHDESARGRPGLGRQARQG